MRFAPLAVLLFGCNAHIDSNTVHQHLSNSNMNQVSRQIAPKGSLEAIAVANNDFAFQLLRRIRADSTPGTFFSPASLSVALQMALNGAGGETQEQMSRTLGLSDLPIEALNLANADLWPRLIERKDDFRLDVANAIFADDSTPFEQPFLDLNAKFYGAEIQSLDFKNPAAIADINDWASRATNGKIPRLVDELQGQMLICNAIYFNAKWVREFDPDGTRERPFTKANGDKTTVQMMYRMGTVPYVETDEFQAIRMAYKGGRASMVILLPKGDLEKITRELSAPTWATFIGSMTDAKGHINLPKFTTRFEADLKPILQSLGMTLPFEQHADFKAIFKSDTIWISRVLHKTFVDVAEKGTEAAAVTAIEMKVGSAPMEPEKTFSFNAVRPFLYSIIDDETGVILFLGCYDGPTS